MKKIIGFTALTGLIISATLGCSKSSSSKSSSNVTTSLIRISQSGTSDFGSVGTTLAPHLLTNSPARTSEDIYVDSYKVTIGMIALGPSTELTGSNSAPVYLCPGSTDADCLIDLAQANALQNLLTSGNSQSVNAGTYYFATVSYCISGSNSSPRYIKAHMKYNGTWWYTTGNMGVTEWKLKDSGISSSSPWVAPGDYDYATQPPGRGCATYNIFQTPIYLEKDASVNVKLFYELRGVMQIQTNAVTIDGNNCFAPAGSTTDGSTPFLCGGIPYISGNVETETPDLQRYLLTYGTTGTEGSMIYGFYFKKGTKIPVGGYSFDFYNASWHYPPAWASPIKSLSSVSEGVLKVVNYGKGGNEDTDHINTLPGGFNTTSFTLLDTVGATGTVNYTDQNGVAGTVHIKRIE